MNECDYLVASIAKGSETDFSNALRILYDTKKPYARAALKTWEKYRRNQKVMRSYPDWEDLFWDASERFCKRLAATRGENQAPNQRTILDRLFEGISHQKSLGVTSPIENCPAYFRTICENLS